VRARGARMDDPAHGPNDTRCTRRQRSGSHRATCEHQCQWATFRRVRRERAQDDASGRPHDASGRPWRVTVGPSFSSHVTNGPGAVVSTGRRSNCSRLKQRRVVDLVRRRPAVADRAIASRFDRPSTAPVTGACLGSSAAVRRQAVAEAGGSMESGP